MTPPQHNATVTDLRGGGTRDEWSGGAAGAAKWAGSVRGYYREREVRAQGPGGATSPALKRELVLELADVVAMDLDTDDVLTFTVDDLPGPLEGRAAVIPRLPLAGVPGGLQTSRVVLEDA